MKMLKCEKCEAVLGYNETVLDHIAWSFEEEPSEVRCGCCGGEVSEIFYCKVCGEWQPEERMADDYICMDCVEKYATAENLMKYTEAEGFKDDIEIDSGAVSVLGAVGISLNDIAVSIAKDVANDPRYAARLKQMAVNAVVDEYCLEEFIEKLPAAKDVELTLK